MRHTRPAGLPPEHNPEQQSALSTQDSPIPANVAQATKLAVVGLTVGTGTVGGPVGMVVVWLFTRHTQSCFLPPEHKPVQQFTHPHKTHISANAQ
mmetsp:Transcript_36673/g.77386  ORF Transcript_36673/g.77386 Transcript_36673/m.77386 type:complete len:95 (+) Transcript_36673:211-495(+)